MGEGSGRRGEARQTRGPRGPCLPPLGRSGAGDITMEQRVNGPHSQPGGGWVLGGRLHPLASG